jgi:hypothetical protein
VTSGCLQVWAADGRSFLAVSSKRGRIALWATPPVGGPAEYVRLLTEVHTGMEIGDEDLIRELTPEALLERRQRLRGLGPPP